jgi:FAS-associated factor 2
LRENTYPFLAVIVLKDNRMSVIARIEGMVGPAELIRRIQRSMDDNERFLAAARAERNERNLTQTIRRQQDEAYQESLRQDQEKEKRRKEELEQQAQAEQERRDREANIQRKIDEIRRMKIELSDQVPDEPAADLPDTIRIVIKLPQGTRLERRFFRSQSLKYLYYFVFCHPESPDEFQIITNFPRTVLPCQPTSEIPEPPSFAEFGLGRSEMFFVHNLAA